MTLQPATNLFNDDDEADDGIPRHKRDKRPKIWPAGVKPGAVGTKHEFYTRASTLGRCLEDGWAIHRARERKIVYGFGRSQGLYDLAQAVTSLDETTALDQIAEDAARMGGDGDAAMSGTALHLLSERADRGEQLDYLSPRLLAAVDAWRRLMGTMEIHGTEQFVVNDELRAAGTYDRLVSPRGLMRAPDGTVIGPNERIILDLKSGKDAANLTAGCKVQQYIYATGTPYTHEDGRGEWPDLIPPRDDWAIVPHIPLDRPDEAQFLWVDLTEAAELAQLALAVRRSHRGKALAPAGLPEGEAVVSAPRLSAVPDIADAGCELHGPHPMTVDCIECGPPDFAPSGPVCDVVKALRAATSAEDLDRVWEIGQSVWTPFCTAVAKARMAELGASV